MIGKVLYSYPFSFKGDDNLLVEGFKIGVIFRNKFDKPECRDLWSRVQFAPGASCKVILSHTGKWFCFPPDDPVPVFISSGADFYES